MIVASVAQPPLVERLELEAPFLLEDLIHRGVPSRCVIFLERLDHKPRWKLGRRDRVVELDRHLVMAPHRDVAAGIEQCARGFVGTERYLVDGRHPVSARPLLRSIEQQGAEPAAFGSGPDTTAGEVRPRVELPSAGSHDLALLFSEP